MTKQDDMPALSHFLENSTHDMQRDAIRAYALQYAEQRVREEREACLAEIETGIWFDKTTEEILDSIAAAIRGRPA